jgi:hypothetical protein
MLPKILEGRLSVPAIASPMFIVSQPELVVAECKAGVVGSFPSLNARPSGVFEDWLKRLRAEIGGGDAPFAVNLIVHKSNDRLEEDLALCVRYEVPMVITSLGARTDVNDAVHSYGGIVLHDVINDAFARKAVDKGADGLIAVATGAGGHAGTLSPFALVQEIREWFDGPLALSGAIATGGAIAAARAKEGQALEQVTSCSFFSRAPCRGGISLRRDRLLAQHVGVDVLDHQQLQPVEQFGGRGLLLQARHLAHVVEDRSASATSFCLMPGKWTSTIACIVSVLGEADVVEEAAAQEGVRQLLLVVRGDDDDRPDLGGDRLAGLVDVELHPIEFLQQVVRELDVGLVDLVDQQDRAHGRGRRPPRACPS